MPFRFEATNDYQISIVEARTLVQLASGDEDNRILFLKLAVVSSVTKFQVFVEKILKAFRYELNDKPSKSLSTYMKMNALRMSLDDGNSLIGLKSHKNFSDEKMEKVIQYLYSISYVLDENSVISNKFGFKTKFSLGKTGKNDLIDLLKQIDGNDNPFSNFEDANIDQLDSILMTRHNIVHQDRFNGTEKTVTDSIDYLDSLVEYIDSYLETKLEEIENAS